MTVGEAAIFYRVSTKTIRKLLWSGRLPGYKVGSQWRVFKVVLGERNEDNSDKRN